MIRLHISRQVFTALDAASYQQREATPACGATDGVGTIKRGNWYGYLHRAAVSPEFHCPECIAVLREKDWNQEV